MKYTITTITLSLLAVALFMWMPAGAAPAGTGYAMNATIIEACSCPMFCQCYFNTKPAAHHGAGGEQHFCKFNMAHKVNKGKYGAVSLDGVRFWIAGDLGGDFSKGNTDWAELTFDPSVTPPQREGIKTILGALYPVKWASFNVSKDAKIDWTATKDKADAKLAAGEAGEIVLHRMQGTTDAPVVIQNLKYFGAARHTGFVLMPNEVEAYRQGAKKFEYKGSNGFMITYDVASK